MTMAGEVDQEGLEGVNVSDEALQQSFAFCNSTQILATVNPPNCTVLHRCPTSKAAMSRNNSGEESSSLGLNSTYNSIPTSIHGFRPVATLGRGNKGTVVLVIAKQTGAPFALKINSCRESLDNNYTATTVMDQIDKSFLMKTKKKQDLNILLSHVDEMIDNNTIHHYGDHPLLPDRGDVNEKEILSSLSPHPFLQTLHGHFKSGKHSLLLLDFCSGGDLHTLQHKQPEKRFSETAARFYAAEVLIALEQLHNTGIVYRDLKPENILIQENGHIKLTDFDLSLKQVQSKSNGRASRPNKESITTSNGLNKLQERFNQLSHKQYLNNSSTEVKNVVVDRGLAVVKGLMSKQGISKDIACLTRLADCFLLEEGHVGGGRGEAGEDQELDEDETAGDELIEADRFSDLKVTETGRVKRIRRELQRKKGELKIWTKMAAEKKKKKKLKKHSMPQKSVCFVGTDEYVAPEVLQGGDHSPAMDWWSYGVLLYEMIYGNTPFRGKNSYETLHNIMEKEAELPGIVSSAKNLISQLLVKDASKRPKVEDIKRHGFFRGLQWELLTEVARPPFIPPPYSLSEFEEKARRYQQLIRLNPNNSLSRSSSSSNSSSNHLNSTVSWIDDVVLTHRSGLCNSSSSAAASLNFSASTHTQSSTSSALSLSSYGGAESQMNSLLQEESMECMLNSEDQNHWNSDTRKPFKKSEL